MNYSQDFLRELDQQRNKTIYARITSLQFNELPIETIEGRVSQGSINIDGASAVRRSCSLTLIANINEKITDYYWGLNTKFKLEIGVENDIDATYPDIIWFPQGIYVITSFSTALSTQNYNISIQGKDKMCLLNGEVGGTINVPTQFDSWEEVNETGEVRVIKQLVKHIIRDMIHQYANEPFHNIIINDIDDAGLELLEYRYDEPLYLFRKINDDTYFNGTFDADKECEIIEEQGDQEIIKPGMTIGSKDYPYQYDSLVNTLTNPLTPTIFQLNGEKCNIAKIDYGETAGYRLTDLIYPDDLIANPGETITSVLDKLKNMLGNFEYFYDLDGRFVFQRKPVYIDSVWTPISKEEGQVFTEAYAYSNKTTYTFNNSELITAFNNAPNLNNLRNDYSVWGTKDGSNNNSQAIHMRYAIDEKPTYYKNYAGKEFTSDEYDWRELIFQMQADYRKHNHDDDFMLTIAKNNPQHYPTGQTGYEAYYIDIEAFWRDLYYPCDLLEAKITELNKKLKKLVSDLKEAATDLIKANINSQINSINRELEKLKNNYYTEGEHSGWNKIVYEAPETLNFWFDFLDADGELNKFSCKAVGNRPKAVNDNNVKAIYFRETPAIIFTSANDKARFKDMTTGYRYFQAEGYEDMFSVSTQGKSAKDVIDELLYNYAYCIETVTINTIPIYYLEPNTRIYVHDDATNIDGDYIISKITIPLQYNGTMSISATKAVERII